jgi:hypothetical protein
MCRKGKQMSTLYFKNPVFKTGRNITCRRGIKWDTLAKENVLVVDTDDPIREDGVTKVIHVVDIETRVFKFSDLRDEDIADEHDPICRTVPGLLKVMQATYDNFDEREIVTLCAFDVKAG